MVSSVVSYRLIPSLCTDSLVYFHSDGRVFTKTPIRLQLIEEERAESLPPLLSSPLHRWLSLILGGTKVQACPYLLPPTLSFFMFSCNLNLTLFLAPSFSCLPSFLFPLHLFLTCSVLFSLSHFLFLSAFISFSLFCCSLKKMPPPLAVSSLSSPIFSSPLSLSLSLSLLLC